MSQNKELKTNIVELQDAFVKLSQQNMELASELETERLRVAQLKPHPLEQGNPPVDQVDLGDPPTEATPSEMDNKLASCNKQIEVKLLYTFVIH